MKLSSPRKTKSGDYRYDPKRKYHVITINRDSDPYSFLITYIHEVAHLHVFKKFGKNIKPHGKEWKYVFRNLMKPLLLREIFPENLLFCLKSYMQNPKASTFSDGKLVRALKEFDDAENSTFLSEIKTGEKFRFRNRIFRKIELKRSRVLCNEINTGRNYLIPQIAEIDRLS